QKQVEGCEGGMNGLSWWKSWKGAKRCVKVEEVDKTIDQNDRCVQRGICRVNTGDYFDRNSLLSHVLSFSRFLVSFSGFLVLSFSRLFFWFSGFLGRLRLPIWSTGVSAGLPPPSTMNLIGVRRH